MDMYVYAIKQLYMIICVICIDMYQYISIEVVVALLIFLAIEFENYLSRVQD